MVFQAFVLSFSRISKSDVELSNLLFASLSGVGVSSCFEVKIATFLITVTISSFFKSKETVLKICAGEIS